MGQGDAACHLIGRTREAWGDERAEELRFFEAILAALQLNNRNQTQTARHLEIGSATLYRKLKAYGLTGKMS